MILSEKIQNCKKLFKDSEKDIFIVLIIFLTAFISFGLGRLSSLQNKKTPITVESVPAAVSATLSIGANAGNRLPTERSSSERQGMFVASKKGSRYYFPWCGGVNKIKEENKIWFSSRKEAEKSGFSSAKNCKGL